MSAGRFEQFGGFVQPPRPQGISATPAYGERAVACTTTVSHISLTGDVFLQPPDAAGNSATDDFIGWVQIEFDADGDDIMVLSGPGNLTPSFSSTNSSTPTGVGRTIYNSKGTGQPPRRIWFESGNKTTSDNVLSAVTRTTNATLRYRVVSSIPGAR